jgi:carboxypeptidase Q
MIHFLKLISMKKTCALILVFGFFLTLCVQAQDETIDTSMITKIREEGLQHSQIHFIAHNITDASGSRLTNSAGFRRAAGWIISTLQQWGLSSAKLEPWGEFGYGWDLEKSYIALTSPYYSTMIAYPGPWSGSTSGLVSAPVFFLEHEDSAYVAKNADKIKGHILLSKVSDTLLRPDFKPDAQRYTDSALANMHDEYMLSPEMIHMFIPIIAKRMKVKKMIQQAGAVAVLEMSEGGRDGTVFVDGFGGFRRDDQPALTQMILSREDYLKTQRLLESGIEVKMEMDVRAKLYKEDLQGHNLVAEIPGTDPSLKDEVVMLGGHLDSWQSATGATDNGAGCIVAVEAVRILKTLAVKPKRTIRICLWDGEEQGLFGSFHYVKNHYGDPADMHLKAEQSKVSAYYNLDNGSGKIRGIFAQGNEAVVPIFKKWFESFSDLGATTVTLHNTGSTDHLSFDAVGIPGFQFIQDPLDYESRTHHSNMDNFDHLSIKDLQQAATILAAFVYNSAMRAEKLPRKPLSKPQKFLFEGLF